MNKWISQVFNNKTYLKKTLFILVPLIVIAIYWVSFYKAPLHIIGNKNASTDNYLGLITNSDNQFPDGNSEIKIEKNAPQSTVYKYQINKGYLYPFVNICYFKKDNSYFDLSGYDYAEIKIKAETGTRIPFILSTYEDGFTDTNKAMTYRYFQNVLNVTSKFQTLTIPLKEMRTPEWWYVDNHSKESDFDGTDYAQTKHLFFANCINLSPGSQDIVTISDISYHKSFFGFYVNSSLFLLVYISTILALTYLKKQKLKAKPLNFHYTKIVSENHSDKDESLIFGYLSKKYSDSELSIIDIQNETGINERKISTIIKKKTGLNFKQFLNKLRISEAKRLLEETDLQVAEIAFKVGYSNPTHFNRVFKLEEQISPNQFRQEKQALKQTNH